VDCIKIEVKGNIANVTERPRKITSGTVGLKAEFTFDSEWDGLAKTAVFRACDTKILLVGVDGGEVTVPWEVLKKPGVRLSISVYGTNADGSIAIPTIWANVCKIYDGVTTDGVHGTAPTPGVWEQLSAEVEELKEAVENGGGGTGGGGTGGGGTGKDGFSPIATVTETEDGAVISITDANGNTNATVKHGKDGAPGKTPVKGVDYFTEEDKEELAAAAFGGTIKELDLSNFDHGSISEILSDGTENIYPVAFDESRRPISIGGMVINWGDVGV
jgi:hypothetical protein